jgi:hypothetical protein
MITKRKNFLFAITLTILALTDQYTTLFAYVRGNMELNPLVAPFLQNFYLFILFTIFKCVFVYVATYYSKFNSKLDYLIFFLIAFIFAYVSYNNYKLSLGD